MNQHPWLCKIVFVASFSVPSLFSLQRAYPLITKFVQPYIQKTLQQSLNLAIPGKIQRAQMPIIAKGPFMGQKTTTSNETLLYDLQSLEVVKTPQEQLFWLAKTGDIDKLMAFWKQLPEPEQQVLVGATNEMGNTAFMCAVAYRNLEVTQFLFTSGSDRFAKNHAGKRAMDIALENEDLHMMLLLIQK